MNISPYLGRGRLLGMWAMVAGACGTVQAAPSGGWHNRSSVSAPTSAAATAPGHANAVYGSTWAVTDLAVGPNNLMHALWVNTNGAIALWVINNNGTLIENNTYGPFAGWSAGRIAVGADGETRVLWNKTDGTTALWHVAGGDQTAGGGGLRTNWTFGPYSGWTAETVAVGADNKMRVSWERGDGMLVLWQLGFTGNLEINNGYGPYINWLPVDMAVGSDNLMHVLWDNNDGTTVVWVVAAGDQRAGGGGLIGNASFGPYPGWSAGAIAVGGDSLSRVGWTNDAGQTALWVIAKDGSLAVNNSYGPYSGWLPQALAAGSDYKMRLAWSNTNGQAAFWQIGYGDQRQGGGNPEVNLTYGPY